MNSKRKLCLFFAAVATSAATVFAADTKPTVVAEGWTAAAPREEIRPRFSYDAQGGRDGKGGFVIAADDREGLDGWWTKTVPVHGGRYYRFHAARKIDRRGVASSKRGRADRLAGRPRAFRAARRSRCHGLFEGMDTDGRT